MFSLISPLASLLTSEPAYLDPGSGSMLLQLLLAGLVGAGVAIRVFWRRIIGIFGIKPKESLEEEDKDEPDNL
jgi:hypothetical protein